MRRIPELDAVRGIAAVLIVVYHTKWIWDRAHPALLPVLGQLNRAVDLFFVLSGFLITSIVLAAPALDGRFLRTFYLRRVLRTWPLYYLLVAATAVAGLLLPRGVLRLESLPYYLTFTQQVPGYWRAPFRWIPSLSVTWSIAVEEQFYVIWPLLVGLAGRRRLLLPIAGLVGLALWSRWHGYHEHLLISCCDGLALGALLAWLLFDRGRLDRRRRALTAAFALVGLAGATYPAWGRRVVAAVRATWPGSLTPEQVFAFNPLAYNLIFLAIVGVVVCQAGHPLLGPLRNRLLRRLGVISYGIYVIHGFLFGVVDSAGVRLDRSAWVVVALYAATLALAELSWRFFEGPILALKERHPYRRPPRFAAPDAEGEAVAPATAAG